VLGNGDERTYPPRLVRTSHRQTPQETESVFRKVQRTDTYHEIDRMKTMTDKRAKADALR